MQQGIRAMERNDFLAAAGIFSELIERAPKFAEGWNKRATAYYKLGEYEASMRDVGAVLELEPRHFAALWGMGLIYVELEADAPALRWFERAQRVHPHLQGASERVAELRRRLEDSGI
jgi:tetratricopeptide (TPR) repeat protein